MWHRTSTRIELTKADRLRPWERILLAGLLGLVGVGIIAMHLISSGHQLATADGHIALALSTSSSAHHTTGQTTQHSGLVDQPANRLPLGRLESGVDRRGAAATSELMNETRPALTIGGGCGSACGHDGMALGACVLALGTGAVWCLASPPVASRIWGDTASTVPTAPGWATTGAVPRRHALTHHELSVSRT